MRDRGGAAEDLASAVIISENNLSLVPLCVPIESDASRQVQSDRISATSQVARSSCFDTRVSPRATPWRGTRPGPPARVPSPCCAYPHPESSPAGARPRAGPPIQLFFFPSREETRPHQRRHGAPNTPRSLTRTPEPHLHIPRTQILDGSVWCVHVSTPPRPPNQTLEAQHHALLPTADELKYAIINR